MGEGPCRGPVGFWVGCLCVFMWGGMTYKFSGSIVRGGLLLGGAPLCSGGPTVPPPPRLLTLPPPDVPPFVALHKGRPLQHQVGARPPPKKTPPHVTPTP